jgi:hypothetical protein
MMWRKNWKEKGTTHRAADAPPQKFFLVLCVFAFLSGSLHAELDCLHAEIYSRLLSVCPHPLARLAPRRRGGGLARVLSPTPHPPNPDERRNTTRADEWPQRRTTQPLLPPRAATTRPWPASLTAAKHPCPKFAACPLLCPFSTLHLLLAEAVLPRRRQRRQLSLSSTFSAGALAAPFHPSRR